jgi:hypothetical protein
MDKDDVGRCVRLLDLIPEWRETMEKLLAYPEWVHIVPKWAEIEQVYHGTNTTVLSTLLVGARQHSNL